MRFDPRWKDRRKRPSLFNLDSFHSRLGSRSLGIRVLLLGRSFTGRFARKTAFDRSAPSLPTTMRSRRNGNPTKIFLKNKNKDPPKLIGCKSIIAFRLASFVSLAVSSSSSLALRPSIRVWVWGFFSLFQVTKRFEFFFKSFSLTPFRPGLFFVRPFMRTKKEMSHCLSPSRHLSSVAPPPSIR